MGIATLADIELVGGGLLPAPSRLVLLQLLQLYLAGPRGLGLGVQSDRLFPTWYDNPSHGWPNGWLRLAGWDLKSQVPQHLTLSSTASVDLNISPLAFTRGNRLILWRDGAAVAGTKVLSCKAPVIGEVDRDDPVGSLSAASDAGF